ncbi:MAG: putative sulfate/molybdate transporter [Spirochaetes bacterium]|nr:putative sulfate/molybdate transporter [Spirochaetota bacterium]
MKNSKNAFDRLEWAGAFGDLGTLLPFVIGYIAILGLNPFGVLVSFGIFLIASGLFYKTPIPVQPMKALGGAAIAQASVITPGMVWGAGLFTGVFWIVLGLSGALKFVSKIASKPVIRGIVLGLGISFIIKGTGFMREDLLIGFIALLLTFLLLSNKRIPAMFVLVIFGVAATIIRNPAIMQEFSAIRPGFYIPPFALRELTLQDLTSGILILALAQIPLTLGNAVIATTAENNRLFPERPVTEKKLATTTGLMNIVSPFLGGVPMCHGAGGILAHNRFGARTGGAVIIIGTILLVLGLFFSDSVLLLLSMIPASVLGVILFFAGLELAMAARDVGPEKNDFYILIIAAGFSIWNVGIGFLAGLIAQEMIKRNIFKF